MIGNSHGSDESRRKRGLTWFRERLFNVLVRAWNRLVPVGFHQPETDCPSFAKIQDRARRHTDIADHLPTIFIEARIAEPSLIVELGVRGGESTFALEQVARLHDAKLVGVDLDPCGNASAFEQWHFVQDDDVRFGRRFPKWCQNHGLPSTIDVLFVDTSHHYDHTVREIDVWFPHLSESAVALFHDTNLTPWYRRRDGSIGRAWDNDRGVIGALEHHLDISLDESRRFSTIAGKFTVIHYPTCNGLTVLRRGS